MAAVKRNISLLDILHQIGMDEDTDFLREGAQLLTQRLIELEATKVIGGQISMSEHQKDAIAGMGIGTGPGKRELAISI